MSEVGIEEAVQNVVMDSYTSFREDAILDDVSDSSRQLESVVSILMEEGVVLDTILPLTYSLNEKNHVSERSDDFGYGGDSVGHGGDSVNEESIPVTILSSFENVIWIDLNVNPTEESNDQLNEESQDNLLGDQVKFLQLLGITYELKMS
ncbi:unnamed protein product [Cochlearia groenlandica]